MWECALGGVSVDLCVGKSECMCSGSKFGCSFVGMRVVVCVRGVSVGGESVDMCVGEVSLDMCVAGGSVGRCVSEECKRMC